MDATTGIPALDAALVWGGAISILGTVGTVVWRAVRMVTHVTTRAGQFLDDWYGEGPRAGVPARPGVMLRLAALEDGMEHLRHEVRPNSGESLRDAVDLANDRLSRLCPDPPSDCGPAEEDPPAPDTPADR
ncbi:MULTISPECIES: hypothetical protein [Streptomyces]|uniref:hypothetical protein n=1 Tax=Streptomyces TaxID=1883 RepID=UPI0029B36B37|nr:hypothetical protein [Streptomyces sp. ME02-6978.2a]MDX3360584.1 hypothetical protein [Streptomyces sp. ME02-6978.2a]